MILKNCSMKTFARLYKGKKTVCFGAGMMPDDMCRLYEGMHLENRIEYVLDNDPRKWNTEINVNSENIPVVSPEKFVGELYCGQVIMITSAFYMEICEQLNKYEKLGETDCFVFPIMDSMYPNDMEKPPDIPNGGYKIPKVIHYCWFGKSKIPSELQKCIDSWKRFCPGYEIRRWDEENYDVSKNAYMKEAYEAKKWGFVSDYARLDLIYKYGGIYLDTDIELFKPLDGLRKYNCFMGFQETPRINLGCGFGALKGHRVIKRLLEDYDGKRFVLPEGKLDLTPCTVHQTKVLKDLGLCRNGRYQTIGDCVIFPKEFLCPMSNVTGIMHKTENTFSAHKSYASWFTENERKNHIENFNKNKNFITAMENLELPAALK